MSDTRSRLNYLLQVYLSDKISKSEGQELAKLLEIPEYQAEFSDILQTQLFTGELDVDGNHPASFERIRDIVNQELNVPYPSVHRIHFLRTAWFRNVAAILLVIGCAYLWTKNKSSQKEVPVADAKVEVVAPNELLATITLSNGKTLTLDSLSDGFLAQDGEVKIEKLSDGKIIYHGINDGKILYNTISVPRGSKIANLTLSDGTVVFLNSASSLRYPVAFGDNERRVEITGEAYFDVARDAKRKFTVSGNGFTTQVLGTQFNMNTYADEQFTKITLLSGSIKVSKHDQNVIVKPGQQVQYSKNNELQINQNADISEVLAWQKGMFVFDNTDISTIARQLSRWYDVEIETEGDLSKMKFGGGISKNAPLSKTLEVLKASGANYKWLNGKLLFYAL